MARSTKTVAAAVKSNEFCVYIGPSIKTGVQSGAILKGDIATVKAELAADISRYPLVADLIVTGKELPVGRLKVKTPGNALNVAYSRLSKILQEGK